MAKSDHHDFISFNSHDSDSCAPTCLSVQSQKNEALDSHDAARVPIIAAALRVLPKWSCRVREVNSLARLASEPLSGKKHDASEMDVCYDLPYERQQVCQSDAEEIFEVVEVDHQSHQEQ